MADTLDLGNVPFYWRSKVSVASPPLNIPSRLPFSFSCDEKLSLIIQERNPLVLDWLERVYKENANVGYLQEGHALAQDYGGEFLEFFVEAVSMLHRSPKSAADIGCGGVYLLQRIKEMGLDVAGIDPSPITAEAGSRAGIEIISDFYPSSKLTARFDVLFHYDVLEHVEDPVAFLAAQKANLNEGGAIVFAVPDCSHHIRLGDLSMMLHEHLNYFDEVSLDKVVRAAGFEPLLLKPAQHGGVLLCFAVPSSVAQIPTADADDGRRKFTEFKKRARSSIARFSALAGAISNSEDLGLYVPLRAFSYLGEAVSDHRLRFFDDDPGLHHRYYDGFDVAVENFSDLLSNPPRHLLICSIAFGDRIFDRLINASVQGVTLHKWVELFDTADQVKL
ncbi:class I SAM-dependent methyltransferase [Pseudomonas fluorescens]|jgi:2-polyprenyl-3-methyl-5-hydroxy-6-metoxy-1,4-benzoquinol methylase|uniref:class I SAM-dependent methyltransferase n=1 Tax=Pseudomonas fluorescens TaxID=294 RepID=UPI0012593615|nr:class I SAM-dependent methyltransferase [Pseudomonas fluorescens]VVN26763.1 Ubiquinone biosynthesis O-methyltransferase [Pseudomonas fluorescens]